MIESQKRALAEELDGAKTDAERFESERNEAQEAAAKQRQELEAACTELTRNLELGQHELEELRGRYEESAERTLELEHETGALAEKLAEAEARIHDTESGREELRRESERAASQLAAQKSIARRARKLAEHVRAEHLRLQEELADARAELEEGLEKARSGETEPEAESVDTGEESAQAEPPIEATDDTPEAGTADEPDSEASHGIWASLSKPWGKRRNDAEKSSSGEPEDEADESLEAEAEAETDSESASESDSEDRVA